MQLNFKFFGMTPMETFSCDDVMKNPDSANDLRRLDAHLAQWFPSSR
jgi:modulator of drug activity B